MRAWPFLFSRGYVLDNQLILCPAIFKSDKSWGEFSRLVAQRMGELTDRPQLEEIKSSVVGDITIVYTTGYATLDGENASDVAGRAVRMVRGLVVEGRSAKKVSAIADSLMTRVTPTLDAKFKTFWDQRSETGPQFSDGVEIDGKPGGGMRWQPVAVAAVALIPYLILLGAFYRYHSETSDRIGTLEKSFAAHQGKFSALEKKLNDLLKKAP